MKKLTISILILFCMSCEKEAFDVNNPDVDTFVRQLKEGTYDHYKLGEDGEKLWPEIPNFTRKYIPLLINHSLDTTLICPSDHFPVNPISSLTPYRWDDGKACIMIGEYLLWCVQGIIEHKTFASLAPILINTNKTNDERLSGKEILEVVKLYQEWWEINSKIGDTDNLPLDGTIYFWR